MYHSNFNAPDDNMFHLWRAVFALVHVDGTFSQEEKDYIEKIIDIFSFTSKQKRIIKKDMKRKENVVTLFSEMESQDHRHQFFIIARTIIWCDGYLHEMEMKAMDDIVANLGQNAKIFQKELRWIKRKPIIEVGHSQKSPEDDVMNIVIDQMAAFYKEKII